MKIEYELKIVVSISKISQSMDTMIQSNFILYSSQTKPRRLNTNSKLNKLLSNNEILQSVIVALQNKIRIELS